ncbi:hypothetical protein SLEP1_g54332 [Rubroshorea leprosula]|uniref:Uncharacterized protein n=1 Tax=Rubroshorea leprosula TaxID=152421 RepID=A0AAV5MD42_9ROSI|nr:hypothetical protein SLEP1_g54332 [Rubroshorea leprosula]
MISSEPCAFVGLFHECTASAMPRIWVLGRDIIVDLVKSKDMTE